MEYEENDNQSSWISNFLNASFVIIISYALLSFFSQIGTNFPFIIDLYYNVLDTIAKIILFIFDYVPFHILNIVLISFPEHQGIFLQNYKTHISGPFSRLFPNVYNILTTKFPLFKAPERMILGFAKIQTNVALFVAANYKEYLFIINYLFGMILYLTLSYLSNVIRRLFKRRWIKICFTLFATLLVCEKWVEIEGPDYLIIDKKLKQIEEFHLITFQKFSDLFNTKKNESNDIFSKPKEYFSNVFKKGKDVFNTISLKNENIEKSILNLDERLSAFYFSLIQKNNNILIYKIKMIHPQPFDTLFIYFIYALIWSLIISLIISIIKKIFFKDDDDENQ